MSIKKSLPNHKKRAVFLDRDGVINEILFFEELGIIETPFHPKQFRLLPNAAQAIAQLNRLGLKTIVVSNQPGVAMSHFSKETLSAINKKMTRLLAEKKARLDGIYYCLHHPQKGKGPLKKQCLCRKPRPGLLYQAAKDFNLDLRKSYIIGDSITDVQAGRRAGCKTILLAHSKCDLCRLMARRGIKPELRAKNLLNAVQKIRQLEKRELS
jgi:D-glycero-D-manno-heptose 1,7-bisphosphate phosphatase